MPLPPPLSRVQPVRAAAALPAAGAWDATALEVNCENSEFIALYLEYTRGGAAGAVDWYLEVSPFANDQPGITNWFQTALYAPGVLAAGADTQGRLQREFLTYQATGAALESFVYGSVRIAGAVERLRLIARESGNVAAPGTLKVTAVIGTE